MGWRGERVEGYETLHLQQHSPTLFFGLFSLVSMESHQRLPLSPVNLSSNWGCGGVMWARGRDKWRERDKRERLGSEEGKRGEKEEENE